MTLYTTTSIACLLAYLFGSLSSAIIVCKLMQLPDPRTQGSRNPGATNVLRIAGRKAALITLLGDVLKGVIPVLMAKWYGLETLTIGLVMLAAILGHVFPVYFGLAGGKGVATALGGLLALAWPIGLAFIATWLLIAMFFRYSSLASLCATLLTPVQTWHFTHNLSLVWITMVIGGILFYRHKDNIQKLAAGKESMIGKK